MYELKTTIEVQRPDESWEEIEVTVAFDYWPEERQTFYDPGYPSHVEVLRVVDVTGFDHLDDLDSKTICKLEDECCESHETGIEESRHDI